MNKRGQGTIEYLIIIAIVVVIALVVVGLLTGFFSTGSGVTTTNQAITQQTQNIALAETAISPDGDVLLEVVSSEVGNITITKVTIDGVDQNFYSNNELNLGDNRIFQIGTGSICNEGTNKTIRNITLTYVTQNGITKTHSYNNVVIPCNNYQLTNTTNVASTERILGINFCKTSGWESNTTYKLTTNPTSSTASGSINDVPNQQAGTFSNCFSITEAVSNVVIDCQNRVITGNGSWTGVYLSGATNITVKNCEINNFSTGVRLISGATAKLESSTVQNPISCDGGTTLTNEGGNSIGQNNGCSSYQ